MFDKTGRRRLVVALGLLLLAKFPLSRGGEIHGGAELRPTWTFSSGNIDTRGVFNLFYLFRPDLRLFYSQGINFDLDNPNAFGGKRFAIVDARMSHIRCAAAKQCANRLAYTYR